MPVSISDFLTKVALDLHEEDNTFPSELWTVDEMMGYIEHAQRDFYRQTGIAKVDLTAAVNGGRQILFTKPSNMMDIDRISLNKRRLRRVTSWDLQREDPKWRAHPNGKTRYYHEDHLASVLEFEFDRVPVQGGSYRIIGDLLPTTSSLEVVWEPYIRWEVLSLALAKDGDNQDMARSRYAHQRYLMGVSLARRLTMGTETDVMPEG